ncbi:hypothetical protein [Actinacidiphila rubida]|uniref:Uncharacterized protein n=1 Tax=Actinacidiphila rubida TaxID=310780 RepID=A0A1H8L8E3_9ACTN|nr:hypothetical protein [Actinacidiphila rubida]SEO01066.1 hypothetical protein SAMN05216267_101576 [Actinacidiphila rubida]
MTDLSAPLSPDQQRLLEVMSDAFLRDNEWPTWDFVRRTLRREKINAASVLTSLPKLGAQGNIGSTYGLVQHDRVFLPDESRPNLTVAAGLHLPRFSASVSSPFLLVLGVMVEMEHNAPISSSTVTEVRISPNAVRHALPSISDTFMSWLPDLLAHEPATWGGGFRGGSADGGWSRGIRPEIADYADVRDLQAYVSQIEAWLAEAQQVYTPAPMYGQVPAQSVWASSTSDPAPAPAPQYVNESLIDELEAKNDSTSWGLGKLVGLLRELNTNFADEHPYACHALLRAVLDHVPPIFNTEGLPKITFEQVASNYAWKQTDRKYVLKLRDFKAQGDDVMHRQIRKSQDLITMEDVPPRAWLNALLREVIDAL